MRKFSAVVVAATLLISMLQGAMPGARGRRRTHLLPRAR